MKKTIIVYGSTTGNCRSVAQQIAKTMSIGDECVIDVSNLKIEMLNEADNIILGTSTWGLGELQDDWYNGIEILKGANLSGKNIAFFGTGDSSAYSDTFVSGMGELYSTICNSGAKFVGSVSLDDYTFSDSLAVVDGFFIGLPIDIDNEDYKTEARIKAWVSEIQKMFQ